MKPHLLAALQEEMSLRATSYEDLKLVRAADVTPRPTGASRVLITPDGQIPIAYENEGTFSWVGREVRYDGGPERAFAFTADSEDKDILAEAKRLLPDNTYLPDVVKFGRTGYRNVYAMPFYDVPPVADPQAEPDPTWWGQGKAQVESSQLQTCRGRAEEEGVEGLNKRIIDCVESLNVNPDLIVALQTLDGVASKYPGHYLFEFQDRNLATDKKKNLVLLDPLYFYDENE